jgi:ubiquinone/menaquinone biosynthesis C-methylase UbiE
VKTPDVRRFFNTFDFQHFVNSAPQEIDEFISEEEDFVRRAAWKGKVLEVGCGYGRLIKIISQKAKHVVGIDFSYAQLNKARIFLKGLSNVSLLHMDAHKLRFTEGEFDFVVCLNASLGNMPGVEVEVIREMKRVVRVGGEITVTVLAENSKPAQIANYTRLGLKIAEIGKNFIITEEGLYSRRFSENDLVKLFTEVGGISFSVTKFCSIGYLVRGRKIH